MSLFRVMTRNVYLGADVGAAMRLLPDVAAAAQAMWDDVRQSHFRRRVQVLAAEVMGEGPDAIGLQEAAVWRYDGVVAHDSVAELLEDLGGAYVVAARRNSFTTAGLTAVVRDPAFFRPRLGKDTAEFALEVGDVLLVRCEWAPRIVCAGGTAYDTATRAELAVPVAMRRGYIWADLDLDLPRPLRLVATHLESVSATAATEQARRLVRDLAQSDMPVVILGDLNADPRSPADSAYWIVRAAGFADAGPAGTEPTYFGGDVRLLLAEGDERPQREHAFTERLDYVLVRSRPGPGPGPTDQAARTDVYIGPCAARIVGRSPPFASDHAGIVADLFIACRPTSLPDHACTPAPQIPAEPASQTGRVSMWYLFS